MIWVNGDVISNNSVNLNTCSGKTEDKKIGLTFDLVKIVFYPQDFNYQQIMDGYCIIFFGRLNLEFVFFQNTDSLPPCAWIIDII